ncbi:MAG TPA: hypothetical protein VK638_12215 [Edaphobacter sp.]|nr:hypothetical protein [Edaphobacter sp.]
MLKREIQPFPTFIYPHDPFRLVENKFNRRRFDPFSGHHQHHIFLTGVWKSQGRLRVFPAFIAIFWDFVLQRNSNPPKEFHQRIVNYLGLF